VARPEIWGHSEEGKKDLGGGVTHALGRSWKSEFALLFRLEPNTRDYSRSKTDIELRTRRSQKSTREMEQF